MILAFCVIVFGIGCWWFLGWLGTFLCFFLFWDVVGFCLGAGDGVFSLKPSWLAGTNLTRESLRRVLHQLSRQRQSLCIFLIIYYEKNA